MKGVAHLFRRGGRDGLPELPRPPSQTAGCNITAGGAGSCGGAGGAGVVSVYTVGATFGQQGIEQIAVSRVTLRFRQLTKLFFLCFHFAT